MPARPAANPASEPARNRCRCGHFPTTHLRVAPVADSGNFRLEVAAPCAVCGESTCPRFTPSL